MGDFDENPHFSVENYKFWEAGEGGEIVEPMYQKTHTYAKSGRINRFSYVAVAVFWRYTVLKKNTQERRFE